VVPICVVKPKPAPPPLAITVPTVESPPLNAATNAGALPGKAPPAPPLPTVIKSFKPT